MDFSMLSGSNTARTIWVLVTLLCLSLGLLVYLSLLYRRGRGNHRSHWQCALIGLTAGLFAFASAAALLSTADQAASNEPIRTRPQH
jgi:hypothetical protein